MKNTAICGICIVLVTIYFCPISGLPVLRQNEDAIFYEEVAPPPSYRGYRSAYGGPGYQPRTMMFHGYYARPALRPRHVGAIPEGAMTAFVAGDTVAAGTSYHNRGQSGVAAHGPDCRQCPPDYEAVAPEQNVAPISFSPNNNNKQNPNSEIQPPEQPEEIAQSSNEDDQINQVAPEPEATTPNSAVGAPEDPEVVAKPPTKKTKTPVAPKRGSAESEDEDEDAGFNPFSGRGNFPVYNSFFPMVFGGGGSRGGYSSAGLESRKRGGSGDSGSAYPGGATAIANSFSTGKGGVATSHATAYGGPSP